MGKTASAKRREAIKAEKARKKEVARRARAAADLVRSCEERKDLLEGLDVFRAHKQVARIAYHHRDALLLDDDVSQWALDLTRRNMRELYEACRDWGWSDASKKAELEHADARYLLATHPETGAPLAFLHVRFLVEYEEAVAYVFELQVEPDMARQGLGKRLMQALELASWRLGLEKIVLTVFKNNAPAMAFYRKLGFEVDETDPGVVNPDREDCGYRILSKENPRRRL